MAWFRSLPDPSLSGIGPDGVRGLYADNSSQPKPGSGIGHMRTAKWRLKKKLQGDKNRRYRADCNSEFRGETGSKRSTEYHSRLSAIASGSA